MVQVSRQFKKIGIPYFYSLLQIVLFRSSLKAVSLEATLFGFLGQTKSFCVHTFDGKQCTNPLENMIITDNIESIELISCKVSLNGAKMSI